MLVASRKPSSVGRVGANRRFLFDREEVDPQGQPIGAEIVGSCRQRRDQAKGEQQPVIAFRGVDEVEGNVAEARFSLETAAIDVKPRLIEQQRDRRSPDDLVAAVENKWQHRLKQ